MFKFLKEKLKGWFKTAEQKAEEEKTLAKAAGKQAKKKEEEKKPVKKAEKKEKLVKKPKDKREIEKERKVSEEVIEDIKKERGMDEIKTMPSPEEIIEEIKSEQEPRKTSQEIEQKPKKGFFSRIFSRKYTITEQEFSEMFENLELILLENNVALEVADSLRESLKKQLVDKEIDKDKLEDEIKSALKNSIEQLFVPGFKIEDKIKEKSPYVIAFFGINGSGKCVSGDSKIQLSDGNVVEIEELYKKSAVSKKELKDKEGYVINKPKIRVPSLNQKTLKIEDRNVSAIWKLKSRKKSYKIILSDRKEIVTTPEHPFFTIENGRIKKIKSDQLKKGDYVAVSRIAPFGALQKEILSKLDSSFFVNVKNINKFYEHLKITYGSLSKAHQELNIKQSFNTMAYFWRKRGIVPIKVYLKFDKFLNAVSLQYSGSNPIPLINFSKELSELAGLILAEGHLDEKTLEITNKDRDIIKRFDLLVNKIFNLSPKVFIDGRGLIRARISSSSIIHFFNSVFEIPLGKKSSIIQVPEIILTSDKESVISFLRSYIEAEAHISSDNRTIEISTASSKMAIGLSHLLLKLGILTTIIKRKQKGFVSYRIYINGYAKFKKIEEIGLYTKKSLDKLDNLKKNGIQFEITELIPNTGKIVKKYRESVGIYQHQLAKNVNSTQSLISQYESGISIPRDNMKQIAKQLKSRYLNLLAESDVSWTKVKSVNRIKSKGKWVYDLTINENHNFIANGIIVHNTTSIAKLAYKLKKEGYSVILAAADTFRAASIEQLKQHGDKLGIKVISKDYGSDPASVAFDAVEYAKSHKIQVVLIDTAGRMHTKENLIKEMGKIVRVAKPDLKIFIGEAITGNDATEQAKTFNEAISIDGIILSKQDVDEKGGTSLSVSYITKKPILYLGMGQSLGDLKEFNREEVIKALGL